jgi:DNA-binding NtrC family response regulator
MKAHEKPRVLLVMPEAAREEVSRAAAESEAEWIGAESCQEAYEAMAAPDDFDVVVTEVMHGDGNWYCVLNSMVRKGSEAKLIVTSDDGRNPPDVVSYGALAFLPRPLDAEGVRTLRTAIDGRQGRGAGHAG